MAKRIPIGSALCPHCEQIYRYRYLPQHIQTQHPEFASNSGKGESQEGNDMATPCRGCELRDQELNRLRGQLDEESLARAKTKTDLATAQGLSDELAKSRAREAAMAQQIEALENTITMPTVAEFVQHCEDGSCKEHAEEWAKTKESIAKAAMPKVLKVRFV